MQVKQNLWQEFSSSQKRSYICRLVEKEVSHVLSQFEEITQSNKVSEDDEMSSAREESMRSEKGSMRRRFQRRRSPSQSLNSRSPLCSELQGIGQEREKLSIKLKAREIAISALEKSIDIFDPSLSKQRCM